MKTLLRVLLVLGILTTVAFLLINLRPERPHLVAVRTYTVLLSADGPNARWLKENVFDEFAAANDVHLEIENVPSFDEVVRRLKAEKEHPTNVLLAQVSNENDDVLRSLGAVAAFEDRVKDPGLAASLADFTDDAVAGCKDEHGKVWFWPRRAQLPVVAYVRPAVEDAYLNWRKDFGPINEALKEVNGVGLPAGYELEKTPATWNDFDLFVAAWYWAHHEARWADPDKHRPEFTAPAPRVAYRAGDNEDGVDDLLADFYRHGMTDADLGKTDTPAIIDALQWRALFVRHQLVVPQVVDGGLDADQLNVLYKTGALAFAPIDQDDSLWLHGGSYREAEAGISHPNKLDWATRPVGVSVELDGAGKKPARVGRSFSFSELHLWALPVHAERADLALALARFTTQRGIQQRETEAIGMLPVRKDLEANYPILFRLEWMQHLLHASYKQRAKGAEDTPDLVADKAYDETYTELRRRVLAELDEGPITYQAVQQAVQRGEEANDGH